MGFATVAVLNHPRSLAEIDLQLLPRPNLHPLERQHAAAPAFSVSAHLAVPGPDIHATARDHTLTAAWRKLAGNLKKQFQRRMTQHQLRLKGRGQCRTVASQWNHGA